MADFNITVSNRLGVYGGELTNRWGTMLWTTNKWAYGDKDLPTVVTKVTGGTITMGSAPIKNVTHFLGNTLVLDSDAILQAQKFITGNTITLTGDMYSEEMFDEAGYNRLFDRFVENAENRPLTAFTKINTGSASYTLVSIPSTTWVEQ